MPCVAAVTLLDGALGGGGGGGRLACFTAPEARDVLGAKEALLLVGMLRCCLSAARV